MIETLKDVVQQSFSEAVRQLTKDYGPFGVNWSWGTTRGTTVRHLASIPGLGRSKLETVGNYNTVNAITRGGGPSWRMVVELDSPPKGWGVYPGGQSGNPGSAFYDNSVDSWLRGGYYDLVFLNGPEEQNDHVVGGGFLEARSVAHADSPDGEHQVSGVVAGGDSVSSSKADDMLGTLSLPITRVSDAETFTSNHATRESGIALVVDGISLSREDLTLPDSLQTAVKPKLLPDNISFMERALWGENGGYTIRRQSHRRRQADLPWYHERCSVKIIGEMVGELTVRTGRVYCKSERLQRRAPFAAADSRRGCPYLLARCSIQVGMNTSDLRGGTSLIYGLSKSVAPSALPAVERCRSAEPIILEQPMAD